MNESIKPIQKILFGSPGTGKSYQIRQIAIEQLGIEVDPDSQLLKNTVKTVFHPEYTYADFMGKLLPLTQGNSIIYKFYPGHFLQILGMAYKGLIDGNNQHYLLVIDELNRGNAAAIFGTVFQLLDREIDRWSTYEVNISEMEFVGLLNSMAYKPAVQIDGNIQIDGNRLDRFLDTLKADLDRDQSKSVVGLEDKLKTLNLLKQSKISIPNNLSILATINTSDESIYYLDSAFKRRWDWEYVDSPRIETLVPENIQDVKLILENNEELEWYKCVIGLNEWIKSEHQTIRRIEDKQIGWWFIRPENKKISLQKVKDKLMFYLWDSVFARDKRPLEQILSKATKNNVNLTTYTDFVENTEIFISYLKDYYTTVSPL
ncbi:MAG: restriction endonuclease [Hormoscilla sp. GM7CHS1pb]|nr:restriction endonuclease [Hormoscilla sp. GM7CHS1pb]